MPRNTPGALRAAQHLEGRRVPEWTRDRPPIPHLSAETSAAIRWIEREDLACRHEEIHTESFLATYRAFLRQPGRTLYLIRSECPSCPGCQYDDIAVIRDALHTVECALPPRARVEFRRLLARFDAEFRRRTLPDLDPAFWTDWQGEPLPWWHRRVYQGR